MSNKPTVTVPPPRGDGQHGSGPKVTVKRLCDTKVQQMASSTPAGSMAVVSAAANETNGIPPKPIGLLPRTDRQPSFVNSPNLSPKQQRQYQDTVLSSSSPPSTTHSIVSSLSSSTTMMNTQIPKSVQDKNDQLYQEKDYTTSTINMIRKNIKNALRIRQAKKANTQQEFGSLLQTAMDLLEDLPDILTRDRTIQEEILHKRIQEQDDRILNLENQLRNLQNNHQASNNEQDECLSQSKNTHLQLIRQVEVTMSNRILSLEESIKSFITNSINTEQQSSTASKNLAESAIVLAPPTPICKENKRSYLSALKSSLEKTQINPDIIKDTKETNSGSLIVKCQKDEDLSLLESALQKNTALQKLAKIQRKGPKHTRIIIKNIPHTTEAAVITTSLTKHFGSAFLGKTFLYKNKVAFSQVASLQTEKVRQILSSTSPKVQIGTCYYDTEIYVPISRCYNCQALGHVATQCENSKFCSVCAIEGHTSLECRLSSNDKNKHNCINCITRNHYYGQDQEINHTAFSKFCPAYIDYFNKSYNTIYQDTMNYGISQ